MRESLAHIDPIIIGLAVILVAWMALAIYASYRAAKSHRIAMGAHAQQAFLSDVMRTDQRRPIWVWRGGQVQADQDVVSIIGLSGPPSTLDDLIGNENFGLPKLLINDIKSDLSSGQVYELPTTLEYGPKRGKIRIEVKPIRKARTGWPVAVIWLTPSLDIPHGAKPSALSSSYALERQLDEAHKIIEALPYPIWERNEEGRLVRVNRAYVRWVEGSTAEQVIRDQVELSTEVMGKSPRAIARDVLSTGQIRKGRQFSVIKGERKTLVVTVMRISDRPATLSTALDVSGEENAMSELSRVLEAQSETLNRLRSPVAIFGPDKNLHFFNDAFARQAQLDLNYLSDRPSHSDLLEQMRAMRRLPEQADFKAWKDKTLERYTQVIEPVEEMWHLPDGTTHRLVTQPHPMGGLLLLFEDVTDQLSMQRSLNTLAAVQRETIDGLAEAIMVVGSDSRITLYNRSIMDLMKVSAEFLESRPNLSEVLEAMGLLSGTKAEQSGRNIEALVANRASGQGRITTKNDRIFEYSVVPLPDGAALITQNDVTTSVQMELALRERNEELESADRIKSAFFMNASYDLRTPLNSIMGFTEMMAAGMAGDVNEKQEAYLGNILGAAGDLKDLVTNMLDLAAVESGTMELKISDFSVTDIVRRAVSQVEERDPSGDSRVELSMTNDPGQMTGDGSRIDHLVYNLISSTLRFSGKGGGVVLSVSADNDEIIQFRTESQPTQFSLEEQSETIASINSGITVRLRSGLGLDLAFIRSFTKLLNGELKVSFDNQNRLSVSCRLPRTLQQIEKPVQGISSD